MDESDVVVIGAGPAGEALAGRCAAGGLRVTVVENRLIGGECSYWACIPSKTLLRPGDVLAAARRVPGAAEAVTGTLDVPAALAQRDYMTSNFTDDGQVAWLADNGIALVRGTGRLDGERAVLVQTPDGQTRRLTATRAVVLATGTSAAVPPVPGLREARPWDNHSATEVKELPRRLLVLGGGAVGCELAQAFRRLGSTEVTVITGQGLLPREEPFAGEEVRAAFAAEGIAVHLNSMATEVRRSGADGPVEVTLDNGNVVTGDEILVAVGRRPATADLGLETVGLTPGGYVAVDAQLRARGVDGGWLYAVGDCNGTALLTHMGKYQARLAADVVLGREVSDVADVGAVPRVTFTDPQVCAVGPTEAEARAAGLDVQVVRVGTGTVPGAYVLGTGIGGTSQLVIDRERQVVIGATFTGPGMQELLHSATIAVVGAVPLSTLAHAVPSFPTVSEVWLHLLQAYGL